MAIRDDRKYWGKTQLPLPPLDLIAIQKDSYHWFLTEGIKEAFEEINPVEDFTGKNWALEFLDYHFDAPKITPTEAKAKGTTYDAALRVVTKLTNKQTGQSLEQEVFLGDIPHMTDTGTFIINGIERAVVNQIVRSPGVFYSGAIERTSGRTLYSAELRPIRGSWLEVMMSKNDVISVKIDRHRKIAATTLLRAMGYAADEDITKLFEGVNTNPDRDYIRSTIAKDATKSQAEALIEIYQKMRPGEPAVLENAQEFLRQLFFDPRRYDLGKVGRYKLNRRLSISTVAPDVYVLTNEDIIETIKYLINLQNGKGRVDDIDHLSNRRVRSVGELVNISAFRIGLLRLERSIREKMSLTKTDEKIIPSALVNARPIIATISEFFRRNRLSTILDQTNPLAEIDNLRRLSVMGTGGVTRERASFSMRDINASQYSRICPVRSPEGPNIGLVTYLALYTRVNEYGFLEAPYRKVEKVTKGNTTRMKVTDEVVYMAADEEADHYVTHAEIDLDDKGFISNEWVPVRYNGEFLEAPVEQIEYIDVVSRQVVGTSASLIPFISHDEANRALMGTHMQCQAVPLLAPSAPIVGTGMEGAVIEAMKHVGKARHSGTVSYVDANKVVIKLDQAIDHEKEKLVPDENIVVKGDTETYFLKKFNRSAQSTCYSQKPIVAVGDVVKKSQIIIDGPASDQGELSLGSNVVIAYTSFDGLGYEDAIIISDRLVKEDVLTSIHINEYDAIVMDTKLGPEELTRDIPNVSETDLKNLGEDGIVVAGSEVGPNDILVGKIAPKGETELTAEERLLRAIFGEKAREVRDTSLRMPHGEQGTVIDVKILDREEGDELDPGALKKVVVRVAQMRKVTVGDKLAGRHGNKGVISNIITSEDMPHLADGTPVDVIISPLSVLARMNLGQLMEAHLGWAAKELGYKVALPVFEEVSEEKIAEEMRKANLEEDGKMQLFDGRTGEPYQEKTVVGIAYMLKLSHMVEDKTHARSTGPYSLVTQQPLGGKAQMGGQRLGEMEVWALESHRAAHVLQEMLTIKSDDVVGRAKAFEAIVEDTEIPEATVPESFKVLVKELNSLGLDIIPIEETDSFVTAGDDPTSTTGDDPADDTDDVDDVDDADEPSPETADDAESEPETEAEDIEELEFDETDFNDEEVPNEALEADEKETE